MENDHKLVCPTCGAEIDLRDLGAVMSHGVWNEASQRHECKPEPEDWIVEVKFSARRVGDPVEWKDGKPQNLN